MKQVLYVNLQIEKNDRTYIFSLPMGAPYGECFDACHEALQEITRMAQKAADASKPKEPVKGD